MEVLYNSSGDLISAKLNGSAISESRSYRVALSTYIYNGGDYVDASGKPIAQKDKISIWQVKTAEMIWYQK